MKIVALVGEHPHDTDAIANLLSQKYGAVARFVSLLREIHGSMLDSQKTKHLLRKAYENNLPDLIIFVRDLDGFEGDRSKKLARQAYFNESNKVVDGAGLFLLNIQTMEALIVADIGAFNAFMKTDIPCVADPMLLDNPKQHLKMHSAYSEGLCPTLFQHIRIENVAANCRYFQDFLQIFEQRIA